jgi:hypothetical protein
MAEKTSPESVYAALRNLAEKLGVEVRERVLKTPGVRVASGKCTVRGNPLVIIERKITVNEKMEVLAEALAPLAHDGMYVMPAARELLESFRMGLGEGNGKSGGEEGD